MFVTWCLILYIVLFAVMCIVKSFQLVDADLYTSATEDHAE